MMTSKLRYGGQATPSSRLRLAAAVLTVLAGGSWSEAWGQGSPPSPQRARQAIPATRPTSPAASTGMPAVRTTDKSGPTTGPVWNNAEPSTAMQWAAYVSSMSRKRDAAGVQRGVEALVKMKSAAVPALMVYLGDNPTEQPFPIAVALSRIDGSATHVVKALGDESQVRRQMAIQALTLMGPKAAPVLKDLIAALDTADPYQASGIVAVIVGTQSKDPQCVTALMKVAGSGKQPVAATAASALADMNGDLLRPHLPALLAAVKEFKPSGYATPNTPDAQASLIRAISKTGPQSADAAIPMLRELAVGESPAAQAAAVDALAQFGPKGITALIELAREQTAKIANHRQSTYTFAQTICAAAQRQGPAFAALAPILGEWLGNPNTLYAKHALVTLAIMGKDGAAALPAVRALAAKAPAPAPAGGPTSRPALETDQVAMIARTVQDRLEGKRPAPLKAAPNLIIPKDLGGQPSADDRKRDEQMLKFLLAVSEKPDTAGFYGVWGSHPNASRYGQAEAWAMLGDWQKAMEVSSDPHSQVMNLVLAAQSKAASGDLQAAADLLDRAELFHQTKPPGGFSYDTAAHAMAYVWYVCGDPQRAATFVVDDSGGRHMFDLALRRDDLASAALFASAIPTQPHNRSPATEGYLLRLADEHLYRKDAASAARSLEQAVALGLRGDGTLRVMRTYLAMNKPDQAVAVLGSMKQDPYSGDTSIGKVVMDLLPDLIESGKADLAVQLIAKADAGKKPNQTMAGNPSIGLRCYAAILLNRNPQHKAAADQLLKEAIAASSAVQPDGTVQQGTQQLEMLLADVQVLVSACGAMGKTADANAVLDDCAAKVARVPNEAGRSGPTAADMLMGRLAGQYHWIGEAGKAASTLAKIKDENVRRSIEASMKPPQPRPGMSQMNRPLNPTELSAEIKTLLDAGKYRFVVETLGRRMSFPPHVLNDANVGGNIGIVKRDDPIGSLKRLMGGQVGEEGVRRLVIDLIADAGKTDRWKEAADILATAKGHDRYFLRRLAIARATAGDAAGAEALLKRAASVPFPPPEPTQRQMFSTTQPAAVAGAEAGKAAAEAKAIEEIEAVVAGAQVKMAVGDRGGAMVLLRKHFAAGKPLTYDNRYITGFANPKTIALTWTMTGDAATAWAYAKSLQPTNAGSQFIAGIVDGLHLRLTGRWRHSEDRRMRDDYVE